ncbi:DUF6463 family protein [Streptomyces abikoensis]|uniref:DUF6463 family protein n=1 Tax=Streptomyces abikoensis TaxID=97398 RepID=UPI001678D5F9|nr:DUF6463 family protein [Streptomyces abikoensis]GGP37850.1 hypothetical protein GCM10010214_08700 [Streptomyces abikoensis]
MVKWAGWIITLAGTGHTVGSLVEAAPEHAGTWFGGGWNLGDYPDMSDATVAWWYSVFSFGPPLLLVGLTVLWLDRRGMRPPLFVPWAMAAWVVVGFVVDGPSPLLILLVAAGLLLADARRAGRRENTPPRAGTASR